MTFTAYLANGDTISYEESNLSSAYNAAEMMASHRNTSVAYVNAPELEFEQVNDKLLRRA
jgi:hypothetical protein